MTLLQGTTTSTRPLNTCPEALEEAFATLTSSQATAAAAGPSALLPCTERFLQADGCALMLEYIEICPGEKCVPQVQASTTALWLEACCNACMGAPCWLLKSHPACAICMSQFTQIAPPELQAVLLCMMLLVPERLHGADLHLSGTMARCRHGLLVAGTSTRWQSMR